MKIFVIGYLSSLIRLGLAADRGHEKPRARLRTVARALENLMEFLAWSEFVPKGCEV